MPRGSNDIDRDKFRAAIGKLGDEYVFYMLDDAIDLLPPAKLNRIVRKYLDLKRPTPDSDKATNGSLLAKLKAFENAGLAGEYYESFDVNSRNFTKKSDGMKGRTSECRRLLDCCVKEAKTRDPAEVRGFRDKRSPSPLPYSALQGAPDEDRDRQARRPGSSLPTQRMSGADPRDGLAGR